MGRVTPYSGLRPSALEEYRGQGLHSALISRRLRDAAAKFELAIMEAVPGSTSQRNVERIGFRVAYTQLCFAVESQCRPKLPKVSARLNPQLP
jgi:hypothetical protein